MALMAPYISCSLAVKLCFKHLNVSATELRTGSNLCEAIRETRVQVQENTVLKTNTTQV